MALYNKERYVAEAIRSALGQSYSNFELLVVDDKSTDQSLEIARQFESDERVRILTNSENRGFSYAENKGIKESRGSIIAFLDADDVYHPDKLKSQVQEMTSDSRLKDEVVYTDYFKINENSQVIRPSILDPNQALKGNMVSAILKNAEFLAYASIACLKESALEVGMFDERLGIRADLDFALKLAIKRPFVGIFKPLYGYRMERTSIMHTTPVPESYRVKLAIMEKHLRLYPELWNGPDRPEIRRQIARCLIISRNYSRATRYTLRDPRILGDFYYWLRRR
jgi:glycosyltransferase involved in cell wall biosynthesis